jgi:hypothetical protein
MVKTNAQKTGENTVENRNCAASSHNWDEAKYQLNALSYWGEQQPDLKLTAICSGLIITGVIGSMLLGNIIATAGGLLAAGLYYLTHYQEEGRS